MTGCAREPHLHVYADRAMWRWTYHEPAGEDGQGLRLQSSIAFADAEEARSGATAAYPGIPIAEDQESDEPAQAEQSKNHRCRRSVPAVLVAAVLVTTAVIILRQRSVDDHERKRSELRPRFRLALRPRFGLEIRAGSARVSSPARRSPVRRWADVVMVDLTKCRAALPRSRSGAGG